MPANPRRLRPELGGRIWAEPGRVIVERPDGSRDVYLPDVAEEWARKLARHARWARGLERMSENRDVVSLAERRRRRG